MSSILDDLKPVHQREVNVYLPYYQDAQRTMLPLGIALYQQGNLEGARRIEDGEDIPFLATWNISLLPADLTRCRVKFENDSDLTYEMTLTNFEYIGFLIELLTQFRRTRVADFPKGFYRKLLKLDE
ncbi:type IV pilus biogenesis protein EbsA [Lyngbya confervoides]|uniref:Uncharacterized protein n=1 Tax=Lyngbya confervoides BDU141951 TaxID=1574623 RepID=A0ABD4T262_9CYAN|nr:type IV pilus biogenesis protein EbsA [Lyngbya confervoides]MCM1982679.1 hypothetical protein [Lyngbya confervoides BDU141951]